MVASSKHPPVRALLISLAALAVPVAGAFWVPETFQDYEALLWLLAVVPGFLLSYHKGWRGVAASLAGVMAIVSVTYAITQVTGHRMPELMLPVIMILIALFLGIGALADRFIRDAGKDLAVDDGFTDRATGLPNRSHADLHLEIEFSAAQRGRPLAVIIFDLDNFKGFNARHGTIAGDEVLRIVGETLKKTTRRMNLTARYGEDEFLCVLGGSDDDGAIAFVYRFQQAIREFASQRPLPSISGGVATHQPSMKSHHDLVAAAQSALRQAKREGRGRIRVHGRKINLPLPLAASPASEEAPAEAAQSLMPQGRGRGRKALIVAEQAPVRALLARYLTDHGFTVAQVSNVVDGVQCLTIEYDLLFTDISLDEGIGSELVRAAKLRWPSIQVVGLIQQPDGELLIDTLNAGVDRYLVTPLDLPKVRDHITELLARRDRLVTSVLESRQLSMEFQALTNEAVQALRHSEETYRSVMRTVHEVIFRTDVEGRFTALNEAWMEVTGFPIEDAVGESASAFVHEEDRADFTSTLAAVASGDRRDARAELRIVTANGGISWCELRAARLFDANSNILGVAGTLQDVTLRKRAEEALRTLEDQLRQAQKLEAIGRLAGGLAHDFNNLLTVIQGNAHLLSEEQMNPAAQESIQQIETAADRGATLVRQLLAFGRRQVMQPTVLNLNTVVESTRGMLDRLIGENIRLELDLNPDLGLIKADAAQIEQVLVNLVVNARDALHEGGTLRISTRNGALALHGTTEAARADDVVLLTIADNGPGMDAQTRERIFEPFFTTHGLAEASGLGLATVYGIVRQSGGTINVQSEPGRGTTFEIAIPRIDQ